MEKGRTPNICYKTNTIASLVQHYCKDGGYLSGEKCIKTEKVPAKETIVCESLWVYDPTDGLCHSSLFLFNSCPDGYTKNRSGLPGMDVPYLVPPGVVKKCYRRITTTPQ